MPMNHETASALDPQAKAVIDLVIKSGRPPYHQLSPKDARQMFRDTRPAATPPAPEIGAVKDLTADGVPVRLYRPNGVAASTALPAMVFFPGGGWGLVRDSNTNPGAVAVAAAHRSRGIRRSPSQRSVMRERPSGLAGSSVSAPSARSRGRGTARYRRRSTSSADPPRTSRSSTAVAGKSRTRRAFVCE